MMFETQPIEIKQSTTALRALADEGCYLGLPRPLSVRSKTETPFVEVTSHIENLPSDGEVALVSAKSQSLIAWRISVDDLHAKNLRSTNIAGFCQVIEQVRHTACVVLAFDRSVAFNNELLDTIEIIREGSKNPVFIDTEHRSWKSASVQRVLKSLKLPHVLVDAPDLPAVIKDATYIAGKLSYLRCLGRNAGHWFELEPDVRYAYQYNSNEIAEIATRIQTLREATDKVYVSVVTRPAESASKSVLALSNILRTE
jgi:hypothetical protein